MLTRLGNVRLVKVSDGGAGAGGAWREWTSLVNEVMMAENTVCIPGDDGSSQGGGGPAGDLARN